MTSDTGTTIPTLSDNSAPRQDTMESITESRVGTDDAERPTIPSDQRMTPDHTLQNPDSEVSQQDTQPTATTPDTGEISTTCTPVLTREEVDKIVKNQPRICLTSSSGMVHTDDKHQMLINTIISSTINLRYVLHAVSHPPLQKNPIKIKPNSPKSIDRLLKYDHQQMYSQQRVVQSISNFPTHSQTEI